MASSDKPPVAFLGPKASYTHQATLARFPAADYTLAPQITIEDVFSAVQAGRAAYGVVPFENSSNGSVVFTLDLFADAAARFRDLTVVGEVYLPVRHCLVGYAPHPPPPSQDAIPHSGPMANRTSTSTPSDQPAASGQASPVSGTATPTPQHPHPVPPRAKPAYDLTHLTKLYSHPQAWGQCKRFLAAHARGVERIDVSSTSRAAEVVAAEGRESGSAAISSKIAAELNGLEVLAEGIEDLEGNQTRFLVLKASGAASTPSTATPTATTTPTPTASTSRAKTYKTLVTFTLSHHGSPGALASCLDVFSRHGLNLTSINTRPSGEAPWHYVFFVECMGRKGEEQQQQQQGEAKGGEVTRGGAVDEALRELDGVAKSWRWLGSWEDASLR